jgi:hypothetical protein
MIAQVSCKTPQVRPAGGEPDKLPAPTIHGRGLILLIRVVTMND